MKKSVRFEISELSCPQGEKNKGGDEKFFAPPLSALTGDSVNVLRYHLHSGLPCLNP